MNKQKGMTLIEVMVAMLILSIAMIGGISFFTSAYRINYSYMESANRIDHALRYVERLKVQKRNYPTYGAFANMGGTGYTVFFVDSDPGDVYGTQPYIYQDYIPNADQERKIVAPFTKYLPDSITANTYYEGSSLPFEGEPVETDYLKKYVASLYSTPTVLETLTGDTKRYIQYTYDPDAGDDGTFKTYITYKFSEWLKYNKSRTTSTSSSFFGFSSQILRTRYLYYLSSTGGAEYRSAYAQYIGQYGVNTRLFSETGVEVDENIDVSEYGDEEWKFFEYRGYKSHSGTSNGVPTGNVSLLTKDTHKTYEVFATTSSTWYSSTSKQEKDDDPLYANPPDGAYVKAQIYKGQATGNERIYPYYYHWYGYAQQDPTTVKPSVGSSRWTIGYYYPPTMNETRLTRYRKSIYISIFSIESITKANQIVNDFMTNGTNLKTRTDIIEGYATPESGYRIIKIPFISLYANNSQSTLSEEL